MNALLRVTAVHDKKAEGSPFSQSTPSGREKRQL